MRRNGKRPVTRECTCCRETFPVPDPSHPKSPPNLRMLRRCDRCRRCCIPNVRCLLGTSLAEVPGSTMHERLTRVDTDWPDHLPTGNLLWEWDEERKRFVPRKPETEAVTAEVLPEPDQCPRCRWTIISEHDRWGSYLLCLNCGDHIELIKISEPQGMREPTLIGG